MKQSPAPSVETTSTSGAGSSASQAPRIDRALGAHRDHRELGAHRRELRGGLARIVDAGDRIASSRFARTRYEPSISSREASAAGSTSPPQRFGRMLGSRQTRAGLERELAGAQGDLALLSGVASVVEL